MWEEQFDVPVGLSRVNPRRARRSATFEPAASVTDDMLSPAEDYDAGRDGHCSTDGVDVAPSLEHLPEDLLLALMHRLDGESLACFGRTAKPVHAASSHIPPLVFASRGRLVVFRGSPSRGPRRESI